MLGNVKIIRCACKYVSRSSLNYILQFEELVFTLEVRYYKKIHHRNQNYLFVGILDMGLTISIFDIKINLINLL